MEIMFDIETLDTKPTAVVLSLGAVMFERDGTVVDRFYRVLSIQEQIDAGRTVSESTLLWWLGQDHNAIAEAFAPVRRPVASALGEFYGWAKEKPVASITKFWANGPNFDGTILEDLARNFGALVPWGYNQLRDQRTLVDAAGFSISSHDPSIIGTPHTPVYDCEFQISVITECREILRRKQEN